MYDVILLNQLPFLSKNNPRTFSVIIPGCVVFKYNFIKRREKYNRNMNISEQDNEKISKFSFKQLMLVNTFFQKITLK